MQRQIGDEMRECIANCTECRNVCTETVAHSIQMGGAHAEASHIRVIVDCAQACAISADFMLRGSELHGKTCAVCAEACRRCAEACERLADHDELLKRCAETCRRCAECCEKMAA